MVVTENLVAELESRAEASGDDSGKVMTLAEKKLGLRHRDSFMVTKSHLQHEGGHAHTGSPGSSRATVAGMFSAHGLSEGGGYRPQDGEEGGELSTDYVLEGLEGLEREGGRGSISAGGGSAAAAPHGAALSPRAPLPSPSSPEEVSPRKKNAFFSFVKGVASALGLRQGKKKRAALEAARGGGSGSGGEGLEHGASFSSPTSSSMSSPRGGSFAPAGSEGDFPPAAQGGLPEPQTDETGSYLPSHRLNPTPRSILRKPGSDSSRLGATTSPRFSSSPVGSPRVGDPGTPAGSGRRAGGGGGGGEEEGEEGEVSTPRSSGRRGLSFADQHGHDLELVRFSERLHYSVASEHSEGEESGRSCSIM